MIIKGKQQLSENGYVCKLKWIKKAAKKHDVGPDIFVKINGEYADQHFLEIDVWGDLVINVVTK